MKITKLDKGLLRNVFILGTESLILALCPWNWLISEFHTFILCDSNITILNIERLLSLNLQEIKKFLLENEVKFKKTCSRIHIFTGLN